MKQVEVVAKASYWDVAKKEFTAVEKTVTADVAETLEEAVAVLQDAETMIRVARNLQIEEARKVAIPLPENAWSRPMASAATRAFKSLPQFSALKSAKLRDAVMNWLTANGQLAVLYPSFSLLAAGADSDDEE